MRRLLVALTLISLVFLMFGRRADAGTGMATDPANDVFDSETQITGPGPFDIVKVEHADDGVRATYIVTFKDAVFDADLHRIEIGMDGLPGVAQYDCQQVTAHVAREAGQLVGRVRHCLGSGGGAEGGPGGSRDLGGVTYSHDPGSSAISLAFDLESLRSAGFSGDRYAYRVAVATTDTKESDSISEPIEHLLSAPPTPTPAAPVATHAAAKPTPPSPTPESTPVVAVTASNPPPAREEASYAAPHEDSDDAFPVVPVAVGSGAVVAGFGLVVVRFWPF